MYQCAVHLNGDLSDIDKFNYLRSLLGGTALDAVAGLALSSANYQQAIEVLRKRFGNRQVIISKHMDALMNMDAISSDRHVRDLRKLYDNTEAHVRSLKSLGIETASYGALLTPVLLAKLPPELRLIVSRKVSGTDLEMDALLATFEEELTARERANPQLARRGQERAPHTASALLSGSRDASAHPQCSYCQQPHSSSSCPTVKDAVSRKHVLIAFAKITSLVSADHPPDPAILNPEASVYKPSTTANNLCSDNSRTLFLQTARAVIHNPDGTGASLEVRLLFDGGSQKSYISERACKLLRLEKRGEQALSIATFGSSQSAVKVCPIVNASPPMHLSLYVMPTICEPLVGQSIAIAACVVEHSHLLGLTFRPQNRACQ